MKINRIVKISFICSVLISSMIILACTDNSGEKAPDIGYDPIPSNQGSAKFKTLEYLKSISGTKTITGQQGRAWWQPMKDISGKYPGLFGEDFSFANFFGGTNLANSRDILADECIKRWKEGQIIALMWHPCPPTYGEPCLFEGSGNKNVKSKLTDEEWTALITDGTPLNNSWKNMIDAIVPSMRKMQNAGVEILWRPFHEMNQGAFWWGGRKGPNGTAKLYRMMHDYLTKTKGITNLIWVWNLQDFASLQTDLTDYDPGSSYYDVLSLDVYWSDGTGLTTTKYNAMVNKAAGKPIGIGESDVMYSSGDFLAQPKWTHFMCWRELTQQKNSDQRIYDIYNATNILTLDEMPGWK